MKDWIVTILSLWRLIRKLYGMIMEYMNDVYDRHT